MTIHIDEDICTRCGICSTLCVRRIILLPDDSTPIIDSLAEHTCLECGHCEAFCESGALTRDHTDGYRVQKAFTEGAISPDLFSLYLKSRRSIRKFTNQSVPPDTIMALLDIARYAASGGNVQQVEWLVIHNPDEVKQVAYHTLEWMRTLIGTDHPFGIYAPTFITEWEAGIDVICRAAPHLLIAHIPQNSLMASVDSIIALTHVDLAAPAMGLGTCWAGAVTMASQSYHPLIEFYGLPKGRIIGYAMMLGYPVYTPTIIPERKPIQVTWKAGGRSS